MVRRAADCPKMVGRPRSEDLSRKTFPEFSFSEKLVSEIEQLDVDADEVIDLHCEIKKVFGVPVSIIDIALRFSLGETREAIIASMQAR